MISDLLLCRSEVCLFVGIYMKASKPYLLAGGNTLFKQLNSRENSSLMIGHRSSDTGQLGIVDGS